MNTQIALARFTATTDSSGVASISMKVPGTFNGMKVGVSNGRYINEIQIACDTGLVGDYIKNMVVSDDDSILNSVPDPLNPGHTVGERTGYPILKTFYDAEADAANQGIYISPSSPSLLRPVTKPISTDLPLSADFVPSGLYIKGDFQSAATVLQGKAGRIVRINMLWAIAITI